MFNLLPGTGLFLDKPNRERDMTEITGPAGDLVARGFGELGCICCWKRDAGMGARRSEQPGQGCRHGGHGHVPRHQGLQSDRYDSGGSCGESDRFTAQERGRGAGGQ